MNKSKITSYIGLITNTLCCYAFFTNKIYLFLISLFIVSVCTIQLINNKNKKKNKLNSNKTNCITLLNKLSDLETINENHLNYFYEEYNRINKIQKTNIKNIEFSILQEKLINYNKQVLENIDLSSYFDILEMKNTKSIEKIDEQYLYIKHKYCNSNKNIKLINNAYKNLKKSLCA